METYQEYNGHVEEECAACVGKEGPETNGVNLGHLNLGDFQEEGDCEVHDAADWSEVVQRHKRIHLELCAVEQSLYHANSYGLESDSSNLVQETGKNEVDFTKGGQGDTDDNEGNVSELLEVDWVDLEDPSSNEDCDGGESLLPLSVWIWCEVVVKDVP